MPTMNPGYRDRRIRVFRPMPGRAAPLPGHGDRPIYRPNPALFGAAIVSLLIWAALFELFV